MFPQPTKPVGESKLIDYYQQVDAHIPWVSAACSLDKQEQIDTTCNPNVDFGYDNNSQRSNSNGGRGGGNNYNRGGGRNNNRRSQNGQNGRFQQNWGGFGSRFDFTKEVKRAEVAEKIPKDQRCVQTNGTFSQEKYDAVVDFHVENKTQGPKPNTIVDLDHTDLGRTTKMTTQVTQKSQHGTPFPPNKQPSVCSGHILTSKKNKNTFNGMIGTTTLPIASFSLHSAEDVARGVVTDSIETATLLRQFHKGTNFRFENISIPDFRQTQFYLEAMQHKHGGKDGDSDFWRAFHQRECIGSVLPVLGEDGCEITKEQQVLVGEITIDYNYTCDKYIRKRNKYYKNNFKSFLFFLDAHKKLQDGAKSRKKKKTRSSKRGSPSSDSDSEVSNSSNPDSDEDDEEDVCLVKVSKDEVAINIRGLPYNMYEPDEEIEGYIKKILKHYKNRKTSGKKSYAKYTNLLLQKATMLHYRKEWKKKQLPKATKAKKAKKVKKTPAKAKIVTVDSESSDDNDSSALDDDLEEEHESKVAERKKRNDEEKKKAAAVAKAASAKKRAKASKERAEAKAAAATAAASTKPRRSPRHKKSAKNKRQRLDEDDEMEDDHLNGLYPEGDEDILDTFVNLKGKALYLATIKEWVRTLDSAQYKMESVQGHNMALLDMARSLDIDKPENLYKNELCHHIAHARMVQIMQGAINLAHYDCSYPHALLQSGYSNAKARQRKVRGVKTAPSEQPKKTQSKTGNGSRSVDSKKNKILKFTLQGDADAPSNIHDSSENEE